MKISVITATILLLMTGTIARSGDATSDSPQSKQAVQLVAIKCLSKPGLGKLPLTDDQIKELLEFVNRPFHGVRTKWQAEELCRLIKTFETIDEVVICYNNTITPTGTTPDEKIEKTVTTSHEKESKQPPGKEGSISFKKQDGKYLAEYTLSLANDMATFIGGTNNVESPESGKTVLLAVDGHDSGGDDEKKHRTRQLIVLFQWEP